MKQVRKLIRKYSLRVQMTVAFLVITLLAIGLLAVLYTRTTQKALTGQANQVLFAAASRTATSLDTFLSANLDAVRTEATLPGIVAYMGLPPDQQPGSIEEAHAIDVLQMLGNKDLFYISSYALLDKQGRNLADTFTPDIGRDESKHDYFQTPLQTGLPYISSVEFAQDVGGVYFYFSSPVRNNLGQIVGVLRARYSVALLQELVFESRGLAGAESSATLLDKNHLRLAQDNAPELIFKSIVPLNPARAEELRASAHLPNLPADKQSTNFPAFEAGVNNAAAQPFFTAESHTSGHPEQMAAVSLKTQPWTVIYAQPQDVFLSPIEGAIRATLIWAVIIIGLVIAAAIVMARWLTGPITHLTTVAEQITAGNLTAQAQIESDDEIGQLALAFNNMTAQLRQTLAGLEQRNQQLQQEITERVQAEEALRESNKRLKEALVDLKTAQQQMVQQERMAAVGQLAAGIAHDFNNILTGILGFSELLQISPETSEAAQAHLAHIIKQGQRATHLVRQILDFSRKSFYQPKQVSLTPFIQDSIKFLKRTIPENIHISLEIEATAYPFVMADPAQLQRVVTNLAINARDAMPKGGALSLRLFHLTLTANEQSPCPEMLPGEWVALSVEDTGIGIPEEVLPHIFEPFFTTKKVGRGTGLGLAQVYGIIKQHEGYIDVKSRVQQGTTFTIYLPVSAALEKTPRKEALPQMPKGHGETILLVEDEETVLTVSQSILERLNYRILTATNGKEALNVYAEHKAEIDLVLTDMVMPQMGGAALLEALQAENPKIKVIIMTGYPLNENISPVLAKNLAGQALKPITPAQLAKVVRQALQ